MINRHEKQNIVNTNFLISKTEEMLYDLNVLIQL